MAGLGGIPCTSPGPGYRGKQGRSRAVSGQGQGRGTLVLALAPWYTNKQSENITFLRTSDAGGNDG